MPDTNFEVLPPAERVPSPEQKIEQSNPTVQWEQPTIPTRESVGSQAAPIVPSRSKDPQLMSIEGVLAEGLDEAYLSMTEKKRQEFRLKGEVTAHAIQDLMAQGKATVSKIRALIMKWLQMIPGVNKFFLEQEAKIKTDKILRS